ncbi:MFS transporter [Galbitalea sp. SE-J8]|uniref:MFS transporter n=1 Tax=Galbitalea sp. SE-J8 TaxID=3054952 RepID=UPI00259CD03C|nr:MFS transporter [Galbitalea sp. SE-J8]MDM4764116.1 MFS transporter [Galbitalea sp. SE-J8]
MTIDAPFRFRSIVLPALAPTVLFAIGEGAIIPVLPAIAGDRGAGLAAAGFVAAMITVGNLLGDVPSGSLIHRFGERRAMLGASVVAAIGLVIALLAPNPWVLGGGILLVGLATAIFALARHAFLTTFVPITHRARALSTLGGTFRFGYLVGPFLGAAVIGLTGVTELAFVVHLVCVTAAFILLIVQKDPTERITALRLDRATDAEFEHRGLAATLWANRRIHGTIGVGAMALAALRASRGVVLPLWAVSIGLNEVHTSVIIGIAGAVDVALFYAGGQLMDRFGRVWTAVPSTLGLALCFLVLSVTHDLDARLGWFIGIALACSLANGLGAGILMTLGADLSDPRHPATFLGAWRFQTDSGGALASVLVATITAAIALPVAVATVGVVGVVGAGFLYRYAPRRPRA